jgi:hypothetical protein
MNCVHNLPPLRAVFDHFFTEEDQTRYKEQIKLTKAYNEIRTKFKLRPIAVPYNFSRELYEFLRALDEDGHSDWYDPEDYAARLFRTHPCNQPYFQNYFGGSGIGKWEQQDSEEFLQALTQALPNDFNEIFPEDTFTGTRSISSLFQFTQKSTMSCKAPSHPATAPRNSVTNDLSEKISIPIPAAEPYTLAHCLELYCAEEVVSDFKCEACNQRNSTRTLSITPAFPAIIILHLKRTGYYFAQHPQAHEVRAPEMNPGAFFSQNPLPPAPYTIIDGSIREKFDAFERDFARGPIESVTPWKYITIAANDLSEETKTSLYAYVRNKKKYSIQRHKIIKNSGEQITFEEGTISMTKKRPHQLISITGYKKLDPVRLSTLETKEQRNIRQKAKFPLTINTTLYQKGTVTYGRGPLVGIRYKKTEAISIPTTLILSPPITPDDITSPTYDLVGMVVHCGQSANSGHYWALAKNRENNQWGHYNDDTITPAGTIDHEGDLAKTICDTGIDDSVEGWRHGTPYLLFYVKRDWEHDPAYQELRRIAPPILPPLPEPPPLDTTTILLRQAAQNTRALLKQVCKLPHAS